MRRRLSLVLSSLLTVVALACGGWLLDPAGSREPAGAQSHAQVRPTTSGAALYRAVTQRMLAGRAATYVWSGTSGGGTTQAGNGALRFLPTGTSGHTFDADVTVTSPETGRMRAVLLPGAVYLALPPAKGLPRSKPWLKVADTPRSTLARQLQPMGEQLRAAVDPAQNVGLLRAAGRVTEVGPATVEGVPATEHRATVNLHTAARLAVDPGVRAQYRLMLAAGVRTLTYQLWLDPTGLPLRVHADVPRSHGVFSMTGVYRNWGGKVAITAPTAKQVFDADAIKG
jgi:hypothetical protein